MWSLASYLCGSFAEEPEEDWPPTARLCNLILWPSITQAGFGFDFATSQQSDRIFRHVISKVNSCSPAYFAGLRKGDRILEINYNHSRLTKHLSYDTNHTVDKQLKASLLATGELTLLVASPRALEYFTSQLIEVNHCMPLLTCYRTPSSKPKNNGSKDIAKPVTVPREQMVPFGKY